MSKWKPIDAKAKDGNRYLLQLNKYFDHEVRIGRWYAPWNVWFDDCSQDPNDPEKDEIYGMGMFVVELYQDLPEPLK